MKKLFALTAMSSALLLAACGGGDINLSPTTVDNSQDNSVDNSNSGGGVSNPCASYVENGSTFQGQVVGADCFYAASFVSSTNPITADEVTFAAISGVHEFADSLFIGEDVDAQDALAGTRIPQEGEGTKMNIEAGVTMVFKRPDSYIRIARGSQIFANGTSGAPIIFTADEDIDGTATEDDRGLWGGFQMNGNGMSNKCHDGTATGSGNGAVSDFDATANNVHNCNQVSEGQPGSYGGNNNAESSGVMEYVVVKYAGFEVVDGSELNGFTFNGVGSGTTLSYLQAYTTKDDGFEFFGGAVNADHLVAVNVGDDSIDYSEGYNGMIQYAVVVHTSGSNRCIEADNTGEGRGDGITPTTNMIISNMTCITTGVDSNNGTNATSKGDSEGVLFREGAFFQMYNSVVTSNAVDMESNECFELDNTEGPETIEAAKTEVSKASSNVIACGEALKTSNATDSFDLESWLSGGGENADTPVNGNENNVVLTGADVPSTSLIVGGVGTRGYLVEESLTDAAGTVIFDQATQLTDVSAIDAYFENPTYIGGANAGDDWLSGWTVGLSAPLVP
ncbi:Uncharacterised protein [Zhongshania aliphaticivorans]|uniref:Serine/threonine protein kinase n=1 Tax=Zhongshania aliphaticivorans TaxID=1470434 RepID=A0A5S9N6C6_9GAMM|nr:hypothetical protein [Zhongshania aliphaticivorans]CAA0081978.1 Uncharacterised protein [Zhongshania aliphaticivorans]CAA0084641.1 Uncharacterised protein [Zhongshania aliphaticivorans]